MKTAVDQSPTPPVTSQTAALIPQASVSFPGMRNTCAIIVTCNPPHGFRERIDVIRPQVEGAVIIDNGSEAKAFAEVLAACDQPGVHLIRNRENLGVATALNQGMRYASQVGYNWALTLDQDTVPDAGILKGLAFAYASCPFRDAVAIVGSDYLEAGKEIPRQSLESRSSISEPEESWLEAKIAITAGSLLSLSAYRTVGAFRDDYFIDCVDMEYCLRVRSEGLKVIIATKALMVQKIGQPTVRQIPWKVITLSNHGRIRRYYMIRNHIDMAKTYIFKEPSYVLKASWERFKSTITVSLFEKDRLAKASYAALGLFDGLIGKFDRKLD
jgi:rhamnosyltransferase